MSYQVRDSPTQPRDLYEKYGFTTDVNNRNQLLHHQTNDLKKKIKNFNCNIFFIYKPTHL